MTLRKGDRNSCVLMHVAQNMKRTNLFQGMEVMDPGGGRSFLNLSSIKGSRAPTGNRVLELEPDVPTPSQFYIQ